MARRRRKFSAAFKAKVALEALKSQHTLGELARRFSVQPQQISKWKQEALEGLKDHFSEGRKQRSDDQAELVDELYRQIGQLKVELDWLKKKSGLLD